MPILRWKNSRWRHLQADERREVALCQNIYLYGPYMCAKFETEIYTGTYVFAETSFNMALVLRHIYAHTYMHNLRKTHKKTLPCEKKRRITQSFMLFY
jgi:hypothetical protein